MVCDCSRSFNLEGPFLSRGRGAAVSGKSGSCSPDLPTLCQKVARWMGNGGRGYHHGLLLLDVSGGERHAPWSVSFPASEPELFPESSLRPCASPGHLGRQARLVGDRPGEEKSPMLCATPWLRGGSGWRGSKGKKERRRFPVTGLGSSAPRQGGGRAVGHGSAWSAWGPLPTPRAWLLGQESTAWRVAEQGSSSTGVPETEAFRSCPAEGPVATHRTPDVGLGIPPGWPPGPLCSRSGSEQEWEGGAGTVTVGEARGARQEGGQPGLRPLREPPPPGTWHAAGSHGPHLVVAGLRSSLDLSALAPKVVLRG